MSTSGCAWVSQTGGAGEGVQRTTFRPWSAQSCTQRSSQSKSNLPSCGSMNAQANSPMWTNSRPIFFMLAMSRGHCSAGQASG